MRVVAVVMNAALITAWGVAIAGVLGRRLRELARRQRDLLRRLDAIHRATVLGLASIRWAVREATRDLRGPEGGGVATVGAGASGRRPGDACRDHHALHRWATTRARRSPRAPRTGARGRGRPPRLPP